MEGSEPAISAAGPTRRCAPAHHGRTSVSTHGGDSTQVPRTEPASPYLLLQDRGAGAPEGGQMAAFPEGRRRTRSRLSRPMSQRARFDAPRRRFVRRTRATTRRPPVVRSRRCGLRQLHQLMHFRNRRPPGGWGRVAPPAGHRGRRRRRQAPTAGTGRSHNRCAPLAASSPDPIPPRSTTRPRWTKPTQDRRNGVCCRSENAATSIGVVSEHRRRSGDLVYESKNDDACWLHPAPVPCRRTAENSRPGGQSAADSDRARWRAQARRHAACGNCIN